jgi:chromosomal replication initiator protein
LDPESSSGLPSLIIDVVAGEFSLTPVDLCGASRRQTTVFARGIAMTLMRSLTKFSLASIGKTFGDRDHSTAMHSIQNILLKANQDQKVSLLMDRLFELIRLQASFLKIPLPDFWREHSIPGVGEKMSLDC